MTLPQSSILRIAVLAGGFLFASGLTAQTPTPTYFPLAVGNMWLYRAVTLSSNPAEPLSFSYQSILVRGTEKIGDREYFDVSYFGREVALRVEPSTGDVLLYDRTSGVEVPWVSLSLSVGGTFPTGINPCPTNGKIAARDANVAVPVGDFTDEIEVTFQASCADVGVTRQYYAPRVGLVRDEETTFAGPVVYRLLYYRAGASSEAGPEVSFTMAVDSARYFVGGVLGARLTLRNTSFDPVNLTFPSGQSFDLKISNTKGDIGYTWSSGKSFAAIVRNETLGLGELTYGVTVPLKGLPAGTYTAQGYLTTDPLVYLGQVAFEIVAIK